MTGETFKRDLRATFSLVRIWNEFPKEAVEVDTIVTFKRDLDRYMDRKGLGGYGPNTGKWPSCRLVLAALSWLMGLFSGCVSKGMWVQRRRMGPAQYANGWHGQDGTKGLDDSNHDVFLVQVLEMGSIELNQKKFIPNPKLAAIVFYTETHCFVFCSGLVRRRECTMGLEDLSGVP